MGVVVDDWQLRSTRTMGEVMGKVNAPWPRLSLAQLWMCRPVVTSLTRCDVPAQDDQTDEYTIREEIQYNDGHW